MRSGILVLTSDFASQFGSDTHGDSSSQEPHDFKLKNFDSCNEDDGIGSFSSQEAHDVKLKSSPQVAIINMDDRPLFYFSGGERMSRFSDSMQKFCLLSHKNELLSPMSISKLPIQRSSPSMEMHLKMSLSFITIYQMLNTLI